MRLTPSGTVARPGLRARVGIALRAFRMAFSAGGWGWGGPSWEPWQPLGTLPGSTHDYAAEAGPLEANSAVSICLGWITDNFPEPDLMVQRRRLLRDGSRGVAWEPAEGHALTELLDNPNPYYDRDTLLAGTVMSYCLHGNAFWLKVRNSGGMGSVVELYWVPHWRMRPDWPSDGSAFLSHWVYSVNGSEVVIPLSDVVHFRDGIDPAQERLGRSRLASLLREVVTDNQATAYEAALLKNFGVPGVVIAPGDPMGTFDEPQKESLRSQWQARCGGDSRGKPIVFSSPVSIQQLSLSPEALALDKLRTVAEDRISAALRLPPQVTGLTSGGKRPTFANNEQARRAAYQDCILPIGRRFARTLQAQLLPDLGHPERERVAWDYSTIAALAQDQESLTRRAAVGYRAGILQRGEARESLGYPSDPEDAVYAREGQTAPGLGPGADSGGTT